MPYYDYRLDGTTTMPAPILYPPIAFALMIPFLWLPALLWWVIPLAVLIRDRPLAAGDVELAADARDAHLANTADSLWPGAATCGSWLRRGRTIWGWPAAVVSFKPSFAPFILIGVHRRSWWITIGLSAAVVDRSCWAGVVALT